MQVEQKLKIKIGDYEFEAEGSAESVQSQFEAFRQLVADVPAARASRTMAAETSLVGTSTVAIVGTTAEAIDLSKITKQDGRVISLTARGASVEDEVMLVLYGQKMLRNNDSVTGGEIVDGLRETGRAVKRVDYQLDKLTTNGDTITIGVGRARRYRLTNQGMTKARELARSLVATVA